MVRDRIRACRLGNEPGEAPFECVLDLNRRDLCVFATRIACREECHWWQESAVGARREVPELECCRL